MPKSKAKRLKKKRRKEKKAVIKAAAHASVGVMQVEVDGEFIPAIPQVESFEDGEV